MTPFHLRRSSDESESAALQWRVQSEAKPLTVAEQEQLQQWLAQSPANVRSYRSADRFCQAIDALDQADLDALAQAPAPLAPSFTRSREPRRYVARQWLRAAAIAAVAAGLVVGAWWSLGTRYPEADYATATGEMRTVVLSDGSTVEMNTDTAVAIDLSPEIRRVSVLNGEAFFTVASDAARPFDVVVKHARVRALGTAFNVRTDGRITTVSVQEHAVRVSSNDQRESRDISVGQQVRLSEDGTFGTIESYNEDYQLAWRRHRLIFENRPLREVIAELNRYRHGYIIPLDSTLRSLTVTAIFDTRNPEKALHTIESVLPIRMVRVTDRLVFIFRAPSS